MCIPVDRSEKISVIERERERERHLNRSIDRKRDGNREA